MVGRPFLLAVVIALSAIALVLVPTAAGHTGKWYWSRAAIEADILDSTLIDTDEIEYEVYDVSCSGWGRSIRRNGRRLFKHFDCGVEAYDTEIGDPAPFDEIEVHILSYTRWVWYYA